jgi:hypothetical protein
MRVKKTGHVGLRLPLLIGVMAVLPAPQVSAECSILNETADGWSKEEASSTARAALHETIATWKAKNGITGAVRQTPEKPEPRPYWRTAVSPDLFLLPDVVTTSDYTVCWRGVVSKAVCTSGTKLCW